MLFSVGDYRSDGFFSLFINTLLSIHSVSRFETHNWIRFVNWQAVNAWKVQIFQLLQNTFGIFFIFQRWVCFWNVMKWKCGTRNERYNKFKVRPNRFPVLLPSFYFSLMNIILIRNSTLKSNSLVTWMKQLLIIWWVSIRK